MKSINLFNVGNFSAIQKSSTNSNQKSLLSQEIKDTFVKSPNFTGKPDVSKLAQKSYETLTSIEKEALKEEIGEPVLKFIQDCVNCAKLLVDDYNTKYGENNWEYISIGSSCASIADILEKMGIKTHTIPISGMQKGIDSIEDLTSQKGFEDYKKFIYNLGLNPETIKNSGKTYVFQDYVDKGNTIRLFEELIRNPQMGLDFENIKFDSVNNALHDGFSLNQTIDNYRSLYRVMDGLAVQNTTFSPKTYTTTPKLHWSNLGKITTPPPEENRFRSDLFKFGVEDILNQEI